MDRMKAAVIDHDAPGHVALRDVDVPSPGPNEALVRVAAVSLNLGEVRMAQSRDPGSPIGWDLAGIVERAAADGSGPAEGARVVGFLPTGAWAELAAVPASSIAELPEKLRFEEASTLPVAGLTALHVLEKGNGLLGRKVLVTGANGGVGSFACQLARLLGARVVAQIRREEYGELVRKNGADDVVVSEDAGLACDYAPYKLIAESVGGKVLANCLSLLEKGGVCVSFGTSAGREVTFDASRFYATGRATLYGFILFHELGLEPASKGLGRLAGLMADGRLRANITLEESWDKIGEVARDLFDRKIPGKAVLRIE